MDAHQIPVHSLRYQLDSWLHACDICEDPATNPIAATCGHLFCSLCLDIEYQGGLVRENACPICGAELLEDTVHNFPIVESMDSEGPTVIQTIVSDVAAGGSNNMTMTGPVAAANMRSTVISGARMAIVQDMIDGEVERAHTRHLDHMRHFNNLRGARIRGLEQAFETVVQMNEDLLREIEDRDEENSRLRCERDDRDEDNRRLRQRIAELKNLTTHLGNNFALGMNFVRHRRVRRRTAPTPIATHASVNVTEEEGLSLRLLSRTGGSSSMNSENNA